MPSIFYVPHGHSDWGRRGVVVHSSGQFWHVGGFFHEDFDRLGFSWQDRERWHSEELFLFRLRGYDPPLAATPLDEFAPVYGLNLIFPATNWPLFLSLEETR